MLDDDTSDRSRLRALFRVATIIYNVGLFRGLV
jgi:hypothetical protein